MVRAVATDNASNIYFIFESSAAGTVDDSIFLPEQISTHSVHVVLKPVFKEKPA